VSVARLFGGTSSGMAPAERRAAAYPDASRSRASSGGASRTLKQPQGRGAKKEMTPDRAPIPRGPDKPDRARKPRGEARLATADSNRNDHVFRSCAGKFENALHRQREDSAPSGILVVRWRDPDSNRGHHDFQSVRPSGRLAPNSSKTRGSVDASARCRCQQFARFSAQFGGWPRAHPLFALRARGADHP